MADKVLDILLKVRAEQAELKQLIGGLKETKSVTDEVRKSGFGLKEAFEFAGANEFIRRLTNQLEQIPDAFGEGIRRGIEFNAELQTAQINIATILRQTESGKFVDFESARAEAGNIVELLKDKANELGLEYSGIFEAFQENQGILAAGGVKAVDQQVDLMLNLDRAMQAVGVSAQNAKRDVVDLLTGQAARTQGGRRLAAVFGISPEELDQQIQAALQQGKLADYFTDKLSVMREAIRASSATFQAEVNRMRNSFLSLASEAAKPIMEPLVHDIENFAQSARTDEIRGLARSLGEIVRIGFDIAAGLVKGASSAEQLIDKYRELAAVISLFPGADLVAKSIGGYTGLIDLKVQEVQYERLVNTYQLLRQQTIEAHTQEEQDTARAAIYARIDQIQSQIYAGQFRNREEAVKWLENMRGLLDVFQYIAGSAQQTAAAVARISPELQKQLDKEAVTRAHAFGSEDEIARVEWGARYNAILEERRRVGGDVSAQSINEAVYAEVIAKERDKERAELERTDQTQRDITEFTREQALAIQESRNAQRLIQSNPFLSIDEKQLLQIPLIGSEIETLNQKVEEGRAKLAGGTLDPVQYARVAMAVNDLETNVTELQYKLQTLSFGGGIKAELVQWANQFGSTIHQVSQLITGTLNTAIQGTSQAITGLISGTKNWQQAFAQAAQSIIQNIIQIVLQWVISKLIMAALDRATGQTSAQTSTKAATQAAASWAPAAAAASIASYGAAAGIGTAAAVLGIATVEAVAVGLAGAGGGTGGFVEGGYTGGRRRRPAGIVHGEEFVWDDETTRIFGPQNLEMIRKVVRQDPERAGLMIATALSNAAPRVVLPTGPGAPEGPPLFGPGAGGSSPPIGGIDFPPAPVGYGPGGEPIGGPYQPPGGPVVVLNPGDAPYVPPGGPTVVIDSGDLPYVPPGEPVVVLNPGDSPYSPPSDEGGSGGGGGGGSDTGDIPTGGTSPDPYGGIPDAPWYSAGPYPGGNTNPANPGYVAPGVGPQPVVGQGGQEGTGASFEFLLGPAARLKHSGGPLGPSRTGGSRTGRGGREVPFIGLDTEFVIRPEAHDFYGTNRLRAINDMKIPIAAMPSRHEGGPMAATIQGREYSDGYQALDEKVVVYCLFDRDELFRRYRDDPSNRKFFRDLTHR